MSRWRNPATTSRTAGHERNQGAPERRKRGQAVSHRQAAAVAPPAGQAWAREWPASPTDSTPRLPAGDRAKTRNHPNAFYRTVLGGFFLWRKLTDCVDDETRDTLNFPFAAVDNQVVVR